MRIQLSDHFTYSKLLKFVFPSIIMMVFSSVYGIVDGLFVSNFVGKTPFAAVNLIMPFLMILGTLGFMVGTGGSAIISKALGEKDRLLANKSFSMLVYFTIISGLVFSILGIVFVRPISIFIGADESMVEYCVTYGRIVLIGLTPFMLQNVFQSFMISAEKPKLGLLVTICAGVTNMVLDFLFIAVFNWGVAGAAAATAISQTVGGVVPLVYFILPNDSLLRLTKTEFYPKVLLKTCTNGSSELMSNISMSLVNILYNFQLMRICGENGVAAFGVIMYVNFIFVSVFIGYSIGCAPVIGYNYGAANHAELKNLLKKSTVIILLSGIVLTAAAVLSAPVLSGIFVSYDAVLLALTTRGFRIYSLSFLICGFNIFGSSFFTALSNGLISAVISFIRTLIFQVASVLILPELLGIDGVWISVFTAEAFAAVLTVAFIIINRKKYRYM